MNRKKHKSVKIILIILAVILILAAVAVALLLRALNSANSGEVADYDTRVEIWDTVAGNRPDSKLDDMNIDYGSDNLVLSMLAFVQGIVGESYVDAEQTMDTFTYLYEIKGGYEKETYEDAPYLIPYVVKGSDRAVIVIPGGGYAFKSMDGGTAEGKGIAMTLNGAGISAFVLHYRSNPYEYPIPQLDVQRAVRYLKYHAGEYGLDPNKIGLIGFSAGGYQIGSFLNLIQGSDSFPADYRADGIDALDDSVACAAMIYPALTYRYNVPMLFCSFDDEQVRDDAERGRLLDATDLSLHFSSEQVPQFVCYGTSDSMVGMNGAKAYIAAARTAGAEIMEVAAEGQDHGLKQDHYMKEFLKFLSDTLC